MVDLDKEKLLTMYETMVKIRYFEETVSGLWKTKEIIGAMHTYIGQEAVAVGVCTALNHDGYILSTHRGHGHCIAKGASLDRMMAELFGKKAGYCGGKGGSMHIASFSQGILGANGIVGGGIPIAGGAAFACRYQAREKVVVCFFGDGASNTGAFHESLNLAATWKLPVVYVCENNLYAQYTPRRIHQSIKNIADRAKSYDIPGIIVDGNDVIAVYEDSSVAVKRARKGQGPTLLECKTYRYHGHWEGDPQVYRSKEEVEKWKKRDPIRRFETWLIKNKRVAFKKIEEIRGQVEKEISNAVEFARKSPEPELDEALRDVFSG